MIRLWKTCQHKTRAKSSALVLRKSATFQSWRRYSYPDSSLLALLPCTTLYHSIFLILRSRYCHSNLPRITEMTNSQPQTWRWGPETSICVRMCLFFLEIVLPMKVMHQSGNSLQSAPWTYAVSAYPWSPCGIFPATTEGMFTCTTERQCSMMHQ